MEFGRIVLYVFVGFLVVCVCCVQVEEEIKKEELARRKRCEEETKIEREEIKCH